MATRRPAARVRLPSLPEAFTTKLYKTGTTRGATPDEIYQNRVLRSNTVIIPYGLRHECLGAGQHYHRGFVVVLTPSTYFGMENPTEQLAQDGLALGVNALVFYESRDMWLRHPPDEQGWQVATARTAPLGGQYVARVPATTAGENGTKLNLGFTTTSQQGLGIRVYEYADPVSIQQSRLQLEALFWMCEDAGAVARAAGLTPESIEIRKRHTLAACAEEGFLDIPRLQGMHIIDAAETTTCPLCLDRISAQGFLDFMAQALGRETLDRTVTELGLFHMQELRPGVLNHRPYNLGWGHHHCNVVVKDSGIPETLVWMAQVLDRNIAAGRISQPLPQTVAGPLVV